MRNSRTDGLTGQMQTLQECLDECVRERTAELMAANEILRREVEERIRADGNLHNTKHALLRASKMTILGSMSENVAHELNQPLAALRGFSDNARVLLERGMYEEASQSLQSITKTIDRMAKITAQLKTFARRQRPGVEPVRVKTAIDNALAILDQRIMEEAIQITVDGTTNHSVLADRHRLTQVFVNLFSNAFDAMAEHPLRKLRISAEVLPPRMRISVRDTGPGISANVLPRLFEPFLTTKPQGQAVGLGLAISHSFMQEFGGRLAASNHPEGGAEFTMELFGTAKS